VIIMRHYCSLRLRISMISTLEVFGVDIGFSLSVTTADCLLSGLSSCQNFGCRLVQGGNDTRMSLWPGM
jgi:hypothetical protein